MSRVRLKILRRQERYEEYLRLAKAEGQIKDYLMMLARLGQVEQVMTLAPTEITSFPEAKALAETLYERLEALADNWSDLKTELLQSLRETDSWRAETAKVNIFLKEGFIEDAIAIVNHLSNYHERLIFQVMDHVMENHSQWVIDKAKSHAESIIQRSEAKLYESAIQWLKRVHAAYLAMDQESEWFQYRKQLVKTHGRKRKLMSLMKNHRL